MAAAKEKQLEEQLLQLLRQHPQVRQAGRLVVTVRAGGQAGGLGVGAALGVCVQVLAGGRAREGELERAHAGG